MDALLLILRLALSALFAVAGTAKLLDRQGSRQAVIDFGVSQRMAAPVAIVLPLLELAVAAALLPDASARWAGAVGAILLAAFALRSHAPCDTGARLIVTVSGNCTRLRQAAVPSSVIWR